uniref:C3H1-type domain-containing protein n=1 Tax=Chromera velia CCMP2878 TaxID=1169474 RepID=A0A0G4HVC5_9ALVE|eukprot:Cvel_32157.t1-p1 / transcript=Cvel_32157.t1 / gene=Cvel_32157 / organism=Chromera_velia_CCMP2878 / gene_product=Zinc finger CCCH domain-containing protein 14, putative / transcript_product=Zinc finger CCCH domain-containing protein 14, putative / location=Cvel_scaffold4937:144-2954(-) / protein_length=325 / sequence_SO=supercontig / SO=protein_coding / is_pseudo=false
MTKKTERERERALSVERKEQEMEKEVKDGGNGSEKNPPSQPSVEARQALADRLRRSPLAKTKLCRHWENGYCKLGDDCRFAHGDQEVREAPDLRHTVICNSIIYNRPCRTGASCEFAHSIEQLQEGLARARERYGTHLDTMLAVQRSTASAAADAGRRGEVHQRGGRQSGGGGGGGAFFSSSSSRGGGSGRLWRGGAGGSSSHAEGGGAASLAERWGGPSRERGGGGPSSSKAPPSAASPWGAQMQMQMRTPGHPPPMHGMSEPSSEDWGGRGFSRLVLPPQSRTPRDQDQQPINIPTILQGNSQTPLVAPAVTSTETERPIHSQ